MFLKIGLHLLSVLDNVVLYRIECRCGFVIELFEFFELVWISLRIHIVGIFLNEVVAVLLVESDECSLPDLQSLFYFLHLLICLSV